MNSNNYSLDDSPREGSLALEAGNLDCGRHGICFSMRPRQAFWCFNWSWIRLIYFWMSQRPESDSTFSTMLSEETISLAIIHFISQKIWMDYLYRVRQSWVYLGLGITSPQSSVSRCAQLSNSTLPPMSQSTASLRSGPLYSMSELWPVEPQNLFSYPSDMEFD